MRARDLGVLVVSIFAILLSIRQDGDLQITPSWYHEIDATGASYRNSHGPDASEKVPSPLIVDLEGDGFYEIVLVTRKPEVKVLHLGQTTSAQLDHPEDESGRALDYWNTLTTEASVSLLKPVSLSFGRQAAALGSGYIHEYDPKKPRSQVIVVVTQGWNVLCFNSKLELLWERTLEADVSHMFMDEVAILVTSHVMHEGDTGAVIVGGRLKSRIELQNAQHHDKAEEQTRKSRLFGAFDEESTDEKLADSVHGHEDEDDAVVQETLLNDGESSNVFGKAQHFSYYAFDGLTGQQRWQHAAEDFYVESSAHDILKPQHQVHSGEMDWRNFRYSVSQSLPHRWFSREDTSFELAHFDRRRSGKDRQKKLSERREATEKPLSVPIGLDWLMPHSDAEHVPNPNVFVAHLKDGIEVIHLFSGRPLCRLTLKQDALHVDVNGDGVIDHIEAVAGSHSALMRSRSSAQASNAPPCLVLTTSAVPPSYQLWNATICKMSIRDLVMLSGLSGKFDRGMDSYNSMHQDVKVAEPIVLPTRQTIMAQFHDTTSMWNFDPTLVRQFDTVFLINTGELTSISPEGRRNWQKQTKSTWSLEEQGEVKGWLGISTKSPRQSSVDVSIAKLSFLPTVVPFELYHDAPPNHLLALGEGVLSLVSNEGDVRADASMRDIPVSPPVYGDFTNDGLNDIIVITASGYWGYTVERRIVNRVFTWVVGCLLLLLIFAAIFQYTHQSEEGLVSPRASMLASKSAKAQS